MPLMVLFDTQTLTGGRGFFKSDPPTVHDVFMLGSSRFLLGRWHETIMCGSWT